MVFALMRINCNNIFNVYRHVKVLVSGFNTEVIFKIKSGFTLQI